MEKGLKVVKAVVVLLIAIFVSIVAFAGAYLPKNGIWKNILKDFSLGIELNGYRELRFVLDDSEEEKEIASHLRSSRLIKRFLGLSDLRDRRRRRLRRRLTVPERLSNAL